MFLRSFINGFLCIVFGAWEVLCWFSYRIRGKTESYPRIHEVWQDRSPGELASFVVGQLVFLCWPTLPCALRIGSYSYWCWIIAACATVYAFFLAITLFIPVGARRRYRWLCQRDPVGQERLFVGVLPADMMLRRQEPAAAWLLITELFSVVIVLIVFPAAVNYCLYSYVPGTFSLAENLEKESITLCDFLYQSVVTISTTGFGDIAPKRWTSQLVCVLQLCLGWLYLIGLLPPIIGIVTQRGDNTANSIRIDPTHSGLLAEAISTGIHRMRNSRSASGAWQPGLSHDIVTTAFAYRALRDLGGWPFRSTAMVTALHRFCVEADCEDLTEKLIVSLCLDEREESEKHFLALQNLNGEVIDDKCRPLVSFAMRLFRPEAWKEHRVGTEDLEPDAWRREGGEHWATYAQAARLLSAFEMGDREAVEATSAALAGKMHPIECWFGDNLLTAICALVLRRCDVRFHEWRTAATALLERTYRSGGALSIVGNLNIWHTALTLELFAATGMKESGRAAMRWLAGNIRRCGQLAGWSWSTESNMICCDSTSAVVVALAHQGERHVQTEQCIRMGRESLEYARSLYDPVGWRWPTFVANDSGIAPCPIVSSRCVRFVVEGARERARLARGLISEVSRNGWRSPWFAVPETSLGLVLWYLGPLVRPDDAEAAKLLHALLTTVEEGRVVAVESASATALGLMATTHLAQDRATHDRALERLVRLLVENQDHGYWRGSLSGVYGMGRLYCDDHFATVLALRALTAYAQWRPDSHR